MAIIKDGLISELELHHYYGNIYLEWVDLIYYIVNLSKRQKVIKNCCVFNIKSISLVVIMNFDLLQKNFLRSKKLTLINYSL